MGPVAIAAIAAILYLLTYLSFVRLLRFPRNWNPPTLGASAATAALLTATVAHVGLSTDGIDGAGPIATAAFIVALFYVIQAPAIAFKPTTPLLELFARHGTHAGLWLAGPALFAGFAIPNGKFHGVLAAALAIEFCWFVRQRLASRRERPLLSLTGDDLSVLKTQSEGDIAAFKRRHRIPELVVTDDGACWLGCGKETPPCPFNRYVNRLGLNTAPCCRDHLREMAHYVADRLNEMGVVYWLEGGTLLGAVREYGELLVWEDDIDISILLEGEMTWKRVAHGLARRAIRDGYYVDLFKQRDFISISFDPPGPWPFRWERGRLRGEVRVDIAVYRKATNKGEEILERRSYKGAMPVTESGGFGLARDIVLPVTTIDFLGGTFSAPNNAEAYLEVLYGDFRKVEYTYIDPAPAEARRPIDVAAGDAG